MDELETIKKLLHIDDYISDIEDADDDDMYKQLVRVMQDMYDKLLDKYSAVISENEDLRRRLRKYEQC